MDKDTRQAASGTSAEQPAKTPTELTAKQARLAREAAALRANLARRKERQRARDKPTELDQAE